MWTKTWTKTYPGLDKRVIWDKWANVLDWPSWHADVEKMEIDGGFVAGSTMTMHLKGGPSPKILLTEVTSGKSFIDRTKFPGAIMDDYHLLEETPDGLRITQTVTVTGFLTWLW